MPPRVIGLRRSATGYKPWLASWRRPAWLNPAAGRTANELASDAGEVLPHLAGELTQAATAFNDVTYGERPGTQGAYQMIADLDDHLRSRSPAVVSAVQHPAVFDSWAQVR